MPRNLKEISITAKRPLQEADKEVEMMSRVVCALFVDGLRKKIETPDFWKISIRINADDTNEDGKVLLGVLVVNHDFPSLEFVGLRLAERQQRMLRFVAQTTRKALQDREIDVGPLNDAEQYVVNKEFHRLIVGRNTFRRPDGQFTARIECEQEMDLARIFVVMKGKRGEHKRVLVATSVPEEFIFQAFFGRVEWNEMLAPLLRKVDGSTIELVLR